MRYGSAALRPNSFNYFLVYIYPLLSLALLRVGSIAGSNILDIAVLFFSRLFYCFIYIGSSSASGLAL